MFFPIISSYYSFIFPSLSMASGSTQVESEVNNKQGEETIKDLPITGEKAATVLTDEDEEVTVHEEEEKLYEDEVESEIKVENDESLINIDVEETEPAHAPAFDEEFEVGVEEFDQLAD